MLGPCGEQNLSAFAHSCAGGVDIIDEEDSLVSDDFRLSHLKSPTHIPLPLRAGELGLRLGRARPLESGEIQGDAMLSAEKAGQKQGLVKPALPKTCGMKGNGQDEVEIGKSKFRIAVFGKKGTQRSGQPGDSSVFEAGDRLYNRPFIRADGASLAKVAFLRETLRTKMITFRRRAKTDPTTGAAGGRKEFDLGEADRAGAFILRTFLVLSTERTFGRKEEIEECTPERTLAHNLAGKL